MMNQGGQQGQPNEPTSYGLQPPQHNPQNPPYAQAPQPPQDNPYAQQPPASPYATPTQFAPQPPHDQQPSRPQAQPDPGAGRLIAGRYRLLSKLGHGGMGTVWRAKDETVDREVAVKEPRLPEHLPERERANAFERMRREARAAARLDHPAVVSVHDVAVEDGRPWIVMEFVQGRSLGDALKEGTLGAREAARIGLEVLGALEAAHQAGILHRDVKPDNVMLGRHGRVVLTDFGIAQIEGETSLTDTGNFVGSPEFIAPERVLGQRPGPASDLWSLGVVLYAATEGVSPFRRTNTPSTLQAVLNATPAAPASAQGPLAEAINGLLQKDPAHRPGAARIRHLLEQAAQPPQPQLQPTQVVQIGGGPGGTHIRLGRTAWLGLGAAVVAAAVTAYLVIANPFAGPLPEGWKTREEKALGATLAVPADYVRSEPDGTNDKEHWVTYTDPSYSLSIALTLYKKSEDSLDEIAGSAASEAYDDMDSMEDTEDGVFSFMADKPAPKGSTKETSYEKEKAAENTVTYVDDQTDSDTPRPREARVFYYKTKSGDLYKLWIDYPGKGDFTERGREVAKAAIENLKIEKL
ncbi:serine/threonine-protein kinase [Streptomyces jeddahensis]|uniref:non-specific serine/threonine protein kinase n=1 Tax=Streptomyces jeddahensis TaxID=1716141 RepID=A0A177HZK6_9ACTN|nr:serine/threonine-protein kinase [Streptomyces jeddahensis]OAH16253.1 serine/threonine-protein kinase PrkC [Streptomyces jeddahensis]